MVIEIFKDACILAYLLNDIVFTLVLLILLVLLVGIEVFSVGSTKDWQHAHATTSGIIIVWNHRNQRRHASNHRV
jgi:hypothetical protein